VFFSKVVAFPLETPCNLALQPPSSDKPLGLAELFPIPILEVSASKRGHPFRSASPVGFGLKCAIRCHLWFGPMKTLFLTVSVRVDIFCARTIGVEPTPLFKLSIRVEPTSGSQMSTWWPREAVGTQRSAGPLGVAACRAAGRELGCGGKPHAWGRLG